jgi:hypothetical protein
LKYCELPNHPIKNELGRLLVSETDITSDGKKSEGFGPNPLGAYIFDAGGHFAQMLMRADLPNIQQEESMRTRSVIALAMSASFALGAISRQHRLDSDPIVSSQN